jgi:hypothetical protein
MEQLGRSAMLTLFGIGAGGLGLLLGAATVTIDIEREPDTEHVRLVLTLRI